jgi:hypothetical protein
MKTNWMYIVTESLPADFWREPNTYSDPLPYGDALALLVDLESQTSREDISFELVAIAQP